MEDGWSPDRIRDRLQIQDILYRYCRAIDRIEPDLLADLFHHDALIFKDEAPIPIAAFVPDFAERHGKIPKTSHMITSFLIDFVDRDTAFVESWGLAVEHIPSHAGEAATDNVYRVRYADVFTRRDDRWRMAERSYIIDHVMHVPAADSSLVAEQASRFQGIRGPEDLATRKRKQLGLP